MAVPEIVRDRLDGEEVRARVSLGGDDQFVVTPTRSLLYRADGLLSGESVEEYRHDAERLDVKEGRRKSSVRLDHGIDGESEFTVPSKQLDEVLVPVLGGVLSVKGVTDPDEDVQRVYRLGELTIVIAESRVIKHVGDAVWDEEFEEFAFDDVTDVDVEAGEVSSQIIVEVDGRPERIKTPSDDARGIRERIESALLAYHDVRTYDEFRDLVAPDESDEERSEDDGEDDSDGEPRDAAGAQDEPGGSGSDQDTELVFGEEPAGTIEVGEIESTGGSDDLAAELAELKEVVRRQNDLLEEQRRTIERLIEELRQGR